ncbi:LysR family transcriptional regulator [uncultured Sneathiella sp.]|jgi:LysR family carnitine catabolism transcriptional activator|uniref:LysR family transcriptional regulator n=1 Tax=uncultured Sneathiella sp. TaxID=879315 RepID=UPI0030DC5206|tara:strand:+ start:870 stop:1781 length:912 start_codon:yes stop_codon:yes gene_type:complete
MDKHFRAFVAVARHLHFTKAAEEIHITQPSLSLLIQQLEEKLRVKLITRSTRQVALTEMGKAFLPLAENVVLDMDSAVRHMRDLAELEQGKVTVAAFPSVAANQLPPILVAFRRRYPKVRVQVVDGIWNTVVESVRSGGADFGIGSRPPVMGNLSYQEIYNDEVMLLATEDHPLASEKSLSWHQIMEEEIIVLSPDTGVRQSIDAALDGTGITLKPILEPALVQTAAALVSAGAGLGIILSSYLKAVRMEGLVAIPLEKPNIRRPVGIITRKDWVMSPAAKVMLKMAIDGLHEKPVVAATVIA